MSDKPNCCETPVRDHLLSLPKDLVFQYARDRISHNVPIGRIAHEAVALIDSLSAQTRDKLPQDVEEWIQTHGFGVEVAGHRSEFVVSTDDLRSFLVSRQLVK